MSKDATLKKSIDDGKHAEAFLNNHIFLEAKKLIREELYDAFLKTKSGKDGSLARDEVWRKMQSFDWVVNRMERIARDGRQSEKTLMEAIKERFSK
jgi:hypothetical protein